MSKHGQVGERPGFVYEVFLLHLSVSPVHWIQAKNVQSIVAKPS